MGAGTQSFDIGVESHRGMRRRDNQDAFARSDEWLTPGQRTLRDTFGRLYVVADGVGGNADGDVASNLVVDKVMAHFYDEQLLIRQPHQRLRTAIERANGDLRAEAERRESNMASTIVAALLYEGQLIIANIGDSAALLLRRGAEPQRLTTDHVAHEHSGRTKLAQAMGDAHPTISFFTTDFHADAILVLCTDGLTNLVSLEEIRDQCQRFDGKGAAQRLVNLANRRGGPDNITVLVLRHRSATPPPPRTWLLYLFFGLVAAAIAGALLWPLLSTAGAGSPIPTSPAATASPPIASPSTSGAANLPTPTLAPPPTPEPTATPIPPTLTPTPSPTRPPPPTATPRATSTATPPPSDTLLPSTTPAGRRFQALVINSFPNLGDSGFQQSCVSGRVRDRADSGISGAVLYLNNGALTTQQFTTDTNGRYLLCELGAGDWSVVLTYIPGEPGLTEQAIGRTSLSGAPEQRAIVDFVER